MRRSRGDGCASGSLPTLRMLGELLTWFILQLDPLACGDVDRDGKNTVVDLVEIDRCFSR